MENNLKHLTYVEEVAKRDVRAVQVKDKEYNASWKARGGIGAYFVAMRKADRLEASAKQYGYDIFKAIREDQRTEGIIDDIRDLRRYLLLWEAEAVNLDICPSETVNYETTEVVESIRLNANPSKLHVEDPGDTVDNYVDDGSGIINAFLISCNLVCPNCNSGLELVAPKSQSGQTWRHVEENGVMYRGCFADPIRTHLQITYGLKTATSFYR